MISFKIMPKTTNKLTSKDFKYNVPVLVNFETYRVFKSQLRGVFAHRKDNENHYWVKKLDTSSDNYIDWIIKENNL